MENTENKMITFTTPSGNFVKLIEDARSGRRSGEVGGKALSFVGALLGRPRKTGVDVVDGPESRIWDPAPTNHMILGVDAGTRQKYFVAVPDELAAADFFAADIAARKKLAEKAELRDAIFAKCGVVAWRCDEYVGDPAGTEIAAEAERGSVRIGTYKGFGFLASAKQYDSDGFADYQFFFDKRFAGLVSALRGNDALALAELLHVAANSTTSEAARERAEKLFDGMPSCESYFDQNCDLQIILGGRCIANAGTLSDAKKLKAVLFDKMIFSGEIAPGSGVTPEIVSASKQIALAERVYTPEDIDEIEKSNADFRKESRALLEKFYDSIDDDEA